MDLPTRKHPSHFRPCEKWNTPIVIFTTVCTKDRKEVLANKSVHKAVVDAWKEADYWKVSYYMIMPDHIHFFCTPTTNPVYNLKGWIKFWKRNVSTVLHTVDSSLWLKDCWDTQMRSFEHYFEKIEYVKDNPVRKGLVEKSSDWEYQGKLNEIDW